MCNVILSRVRVTICCRGKAIRSTYNECVSVFLKLLSGGQAAVCLSHIICHLLAVWLCHTFPHYLKKIRGKKLLNRKCVNDLLYNLCLKKVSF